MTVPQAFELALAHHRAGRLAEAEAIYRQILAVQPNHAGALEHLGVAAQQCGRYDLAVEWIRRAIAIDPNNATAHSNLGEAYRALGRLDEAIASYRQAIELKPDYPEAHNNLGNGLWMTGQFESALSACRRALELKPDYPEAHLNLGNALAALGRLDEAISAFRAALQARPNYLKVHNSLAGAFWEQGRLEEAISSYRRLLEAAPHDAGAHSNLIRALHYLPGDSASLIATEQDRWNRQFGQSPEGLPRQYPNDRTPNRRLRIGYVSPDFRNHVVGRYLLPLLENHDHENFEIVCYSGVVRPDAMTENFRRAAALWRGTVGVPDDTLAEMIRGDQIDILVDLSQHTGGNRLPMFARHPAPVQVSFGGYPESTGLEAIQYRISDRWLEAGASEIGEERFARRSEMEDGRSEQWRGADLRSPISHLRPAEQVYLLDSFWCFDPCGVAIEVNESPAKARGNVTFGSLNSFCKVNDPLLKLWARVLGQTSNSRLVLRTGFGSHRQRTLEFLAQEGVAANRVEFVEWCPRQAYLELYHRLDIALDPFPYGGHTTTVDALWMGVPVVSLAGNTPVSRGGLSILSNAGLPELVANSEDAYVRIATELAQDLPRLANLRSILRSRMENSVLMNAQHFTRQIETAYRSMWREWVEGGGGDNDK